jgi:quinol-cytochrome oxidoreductase complex cytochrome b subunit
MGESSIQVGKTRVSLRGIIAIILVVTVCVLGVLGMEIPSVLAELTIAACAFYYGSRNASPTKEP